jgi:hypothetical protein
MALDMGCGIYHSIPYGQTTIVYLLTLRAYLAPTETMRSRVLCEVQKPTMAETKGGVHDNQQVKRQQSTATHCTARHGTALQSNASRAKQRRAVHRKAPPASHRNVMQGSAAQCQQSKAVHSTAGQRTAQQPIASRAEQPKAVHCTARHRQQRIARQGKVMQRIASNAGHCIAGQRIASQRQQHKPSPATQGDSNYGSQNETGRIPQW